MPIYDHTWLIAEWERMGKPIRETLDPSDGLWLELYEEDCDFFENALYRIKSKPSINWDHVRPDIAAMASNRSGTYLYKEKPFFDGFQWVGVIYGHSESFSSFFQGTCDHKDSLVMRPVVKQQLT